MYDITVMHRESDIYERLPLGHDIAVFHSTTFSVSQVDMIVHRIRAA